MKLSKIVAGLAVAAGTLVGQSVFAAPVAITAPPDTVAATFTDIDWSSNGTAFTQNFAPIVGQTFTLTYFANAVALKNGSLVVPTPTLDSSTNGVKDAGKNYELTTVAVIQEKVVFCSPPGPSQTCTFDVTSGTFNIYYDQLANANNSLGTGFGNGELLISGSVTPTMFGSGGVFTAFPFNGGAGGSGSAALGGSVNFTQTTCDGTHPACISPALTGSTLTTQINFGTSTTAAPATGYEGTAFNGSNVVFQADGNQSFVSVPEPDSVALLGLGAGLLGLVLRRRKAAAA